MTQIERILYESSLISDAFKKMMWKTGQISLDAIYSAPKLAELHEDIFPQLVDQFLNFSRILDKPLKAHTLMQTIARANRVH